MYHCDGSDLWFFLRTGSAMSIMTIDDLFFSDEKDFTCLDS